MAFELPPINKRVRQIVDHYAKGNVTKFVQMLNSGGTGEVIAQQTFNRIFNVDTRTKKIPAVPTAITTAITNHFKEVSATWLLTGEGSMFAKTDGYVEYDMGAAIKKIEATVEVILSAVAEVVAKQTNQSATVLRAQFQGLVNERLKPSGPGQSTAVVQG